MERQVFAVWLIFSSQLVLADPAGQQDAIEIYSLHVDCKVTSRFAHTVITSRVVNKADESKEALFEVELPKTAFITNFSMTIDEKTYPGTIKEKKTAQDQYDDAVSQGQSAGLVRSTGRKLEQFHVSVNVAAAGKVTFELVYEELLKRNLGKYELLIKVKPKQLVKHFQIDTHIFEPQGISFLETDSTFLTNELSNALTKEQGETKAHISFKPTITQQRKSPDLEETLLDGDFLIRYDVQRAFAAGDIQIVNGYFVHYFAPSEMPVFPKNIVFVIDRSGSMSGTKIKQTKEALQKILEDLNPEDHFNIIIFSGSITVWKPSLLPATEENVELAKRYVGDISAQGATDINGALLMAMQALDKATAEELLPEESVSMIILLTDGQPTTGVTDTGNIQENIKQSNNEKYFLYCLGFGFDVSYTFLEKMALENEGIARRIYEDSDAALQLQNFYREVATPILKVVEIKYPDNAAEEITQNNFKLHFDGSEIVVAGKIGNELDVFPVEIKALTQISNLTLKEEVNVTEKEEVFRHQKYIFGNFIERLWAYLTIQQLLEKSVSAEGEQQKSLEAQALDLSLKFSFVTPLTSMVVTKPDAQEVANKPTEADNENFRNGGVPQGLPGMAMRFHMPTRSRLVHGRLDSGDSDDYSTDKLHKGILQPQTTVDRFHHRRESGYPHFILQLPGENNVICLNISPYSQIPALQVLLSDPAKGIQVTGQLGEKKQVVLFQVAYHNAGVKINVTKDYIMLNDHGNATMLPWTTTMSRTVQGLKVIIEEDRSVSVSGADNITVKISSVKFPEQFLGLYFMGSENFSDQVTGLLGQFYFNTHFGNPGGRKPSRRRPIVVQGRTYHTIRQEKKDYRAESSKDAVSCWVLNIIP